MLGKTVDDGLDFLQNAVLRERMASGYVAFPVRIDCVMTRPCDDGTSLTAASEGTVLTNVSATDESQVFSVYYELMASSDGEIS